MSTRLPTEGRAGTEHPSLQPTPPPDRTNQPTEAFATGLIPSSFPVLDCPSHAPPLPTRLGSYEIKHELARGGMGIVYEGYDPLLRRRVAIKIPRPGWLSSAEILQRFHLEAEAMAQLQHPNIVAVYEVGWHENLPFVAMEYLSGTTLHERNQGRRPTPIEAAKLLRDLAAGTAHAHMHGVLHRDLKPGNVLFSCEGTPKIIDFGAARFTFNANLDSSLTQVGTVIGTPQYMAPEQASGDPTKASTAADIYSLGAILYELLTGGPPFNSSDPYQVLKAVQTQDITPPRSLNPRIPRDLETICMKCLAKEPLKRYRSAEELRSDLDRFLNGDPIQARPVGLVERLYHKARKRPTAAGLVIGLIFAGLLGLGAFGWQFRETVKALDQAQNEKRDADASKLAAERLGKTYQEQRDKAEWLVYRMRIAQAQQSIEHANIDTALSLLEEADTTSAGWEFEFLKQRCQQSLWMRELLPEPGQPKSPMWVHLIAVHPSKDYIAVTTSDPYEGSNKNPLYTNPVSLVMLEASTGRRATTRHEIFPRMIHALFWIDSDHLVAVDITHQIFVWNWKTGSIVRQWLNSQKPPITRHSPFLYSATWSKTPGEMDGIARCINPYQVEVIDPTGVRPKRTILLPSKSPEPAQMLCRYGLLLVHQRRGQGTASTDTVYDLRKNAIVLSRDSLESCMELSPDGRWLVIHEKTAQPGLCEVLVYDTQTWQLAWRRLAHDEVSQQIHFSPDSRWFCLRAVPEKSVRCYQIDSREGVTCHGHEAAIRQVHPSPDGQYLVTSSDDRTVRLWDPFSGKPLGLLRGHQHSVRAVSFGPDVKRIYSAGADQKVICWDLARTESMGGLLPNPQTKSKGTTFHAMTYTPTGRLRLLDTFRGLMEFDPVSGHLVQQQKLPQLWQRHGKELVDGHFTPDGTRFCAIDLKSNHGISVWDANTGEVLQRLDVKFSRILSVSISDDGQRICASGFILQGQDRPRRSVAAVWDVASGEQIVIHDFEESIIVGTAFLPTSHEFVLGCYHPKNPTGNLPGIRWYSAQGILQNELRLPVDDQQPGLSADLVTSFAFDPAGEYLVATSWSTPQVFVLRRKTGALVRRLELDRPCTWAAFSPDGKRLALTGYEGRVQIFDTIHWDEIVTLVASRDRLDDYAFPARVAFSPDGRTLAANDWKGEIAIWTIPDNTGNFQAKRRLERESAGFRFHLESALAAYQRRNEFAYCFHAQHLNKLTHEAGLPTELVQFWQNQRGEHEARRRLPALAGGVVLNPW